MAKRTYNEQDRAAVFITLKVNEGNVARSSRETGVPEQTVREWKNNWATHKWDTPDMEAQTEAVQEATAVAERVRDKALLLLEERLHEVKAPEKLATVYGILDDKVRLQKGLPTSRSESTLALPPAAEVRDTLLEGVRLALRAQAERDEDIIDVEVEEQATKALPARTE